MQYISSLTFSQFHGPLQTVDCVKPVDTDICVKAFLDESEEPELFYPQDFKEWADDILEEDYDMSNNHTNVQGTIFVSCVP